MGRFVVTEYISVDGVIEAPSGQEDFERVGWTDGYRRGPEGDAFKWEETRAADAMLFGRTTFEAFAEVWPHVEGEFAEMFNRLPKYVVATKQVDLSSWEPASVVDGSGDVIAELRDLRGKYERDIVVHGSGEVARTLIENDLVDELRLMVYPIVVGAGKPLFGDTSAVKRLRLTETNTFGDVHLLVYQRA